MRTGALYRGDERLVGTVWLADDWVGRLRGLLGRAPLAAGEGLLLEPCDGVHTCWMRYPIDVLFLDRNRRVLGWRECVPPWRACRQGGARSTLELHAGGLAALRPVLGEQLLWRTAAAVPAPLRFATPRSETTSTGDKEPNE